MKTQELSPNNAWVSLVFSLSLLWIVHVGNKTKVSYKLIWLIFRRRRSNSLKNCYKRSWVYWWSCLFRSTNASSYVRGSVWWRQLDSMNHDGFLRSLTLFRVDRQETNKQRINEKRSANHIDELCLRMDPWWIRFTCLSSRSDNKDMNDLVEETLENKVVIFLGRTGSGESRWLTLAVNYASPNRKNKSIQSPLEFAPTIGKFCYLDHENVRLENTDRYNIYRYDRFSRYNRREWTQITSSTFPQRDSTRIWHK